MAENTADDIKRWLERTPLPSTVAKLVVAGADVTSRASETRFPLHTRGSYLLPQSVIDSLTATPDSALWIRGGAVTRSLADQLRHPMEDAPSWVVLGFNSLSISTESAPDSWSRAEVAVGVSASNDGAWTRQLSVEAEGDTCVVLVFTRTDPSAEELSSEILDLLEIDNAPGSQPLTTAQIVDLAGEFLKRVDVKSTQSGGGA